MDGSGDKSEKGSLGEVEYEKLSNNLKNGAQIPIDEAVPWLMSFADMVTLLMCFFILFFQTDKGNLKIDNPDELMEKLQQLSQFMGMDGAEKVQQQTNMTDRATSGASGSVEDLKAEMTKISKQLDLLFSVGVTRPDEVELTFLNQKFFKSGSTDLTRAASKLLESVSKRLIEYSPNSEIEVEGHTDSDPIKSWKFPSNWELSGARAATVVRLLQGHGLNPSKMKASGFAHFKPIIPETEKNPTKLRQIKALNRRIVIRIRQLAIDDPEPRQKKKKQKKPKKESMKNLSPREMGTRLNKYLDKQKKKSDR